MKMNGVIQRCRDWLFPLQSEAGRKSAKAIAELDAVIQEIKQTRSDALFSRHQEFSVEPQGAEPPRKDNIYVMD